ncbi:MAG: hypothetical protein H0V46_02420 [Sphingomonas sp.]|nr:hypothetical protein [Sphingomonas sp.]
MGKDFLSYYLQRAAEEMAAAEGASSAAAADAHRELSLRYSLKLILPECTNDNDDARPIGLPKPVPQRAVPSPSGRGPAKRRRA